MSPSERAWLYVPGNEQTLRLPVSGRFTNRNDLSVGCYLHSALGGSFMAPQQSGCKSTAFSLKTLNLNNTRRRLLRFFNIILLSTLIAFHQNYVLLRQNITINEHSSSISRRSWKETWSFYAETVYEGFGQDGYRVFR